MARPAPQVRMSIRYKLALATLIPVILLWVVVYRADNILEDALDRQSERSLEDVAAVAAEDLTARLQEQVAFWQGWAESPAVLDELASSNARLANLPDGENLLASRDREQRAGRRSDSRQLAIHGGPLSEDLRRVQRLAARRGRGVFSEVLLTNAFGTSVAQTGWTGDFRHDDEEWWRRTRELGVVVEDVGFEGSPAAASLALCLCVGHEDGRCAGVLRAVVNPGSIFGHLDERARDLGMRLVLEREDGTVLHRSPPLPGSGSGTRPLEAVAGLQADGLLPRWRLRVQRSTQGPLAAVVAQRNALWWHGGLATLFGFALAAFATIQLSRRIMGLSRGVQVLAGGDLSVRMDERVHDELSVLGNGLNDMARRLAQANDELNRQNEELRAEIEERRRLQERHRAILDSAYEAFVAIDEGGRVTEWNLRAQLLFGWCREDVEGKLFVDVIVPPEKRQVCLEALARFRESGDVPVPNDWTELECVSKDGVRIPVKALIWPSISDERVSFNAFLVDLTQELRDREERKRLEAQILQSSKLEAIGQLAAGIAHEINTPTQYIGDNTRFLQDAFADLDRVVRRVCTLLEDPDAPDGFARELQGLLEEADVEYLEKEVPVAIQQALEGVQRVAEIVAAMKNFSHTGNPSEMEPVDLNEGVRSTVTIARNEWKYVADLELDLDPRLPVVRCHAGAVNQVVLNLIVNAAHAIAEVVDRDAGEKGKIVVATRHRGDEVEIAVSDTGPGIPSEVQDRIFEPFFTTKEVGKGTGQGLSIAHDVIVGKHGGTLTFETEPGRGTTFLARIPVTPQSVQEASR